MPDPIQSNQNASCSYPKPDDAAAQGCDPNTASCGPRPGTSTTVVTLEPVVIEGDAGTQALLRKYQADQCRDERGAATFTCATAAASALGTLASTPTVVGVAFSAYATAASAAACSFALAAYDDCLDQAQARGEGAALCEADGGIPVTGAYDELVCLVP